MNCEDGLYKELLQRLTPLFSTARSIKRTVANFAAMHRMVGNEINSADLLAWAALGALRPDLQRRISDNIDSYVFNPSRQLLNTPQSTEDALQLDNASPEAGLVTFMFPRLRKQRPDTEKFGRIQERSNAWTLLWLGVPPFNVSRETMDRFWKNPSEGSLEGLDDSQRAQLFGRLLQRMPDLPSEGDAPFWRFVAKLAQRDDTGLQ